MRVDEGIYNINKVICDNINLMDFDSVQRETISQNLLSQSRNLVEHLLLKAYFNGVNNEVDWNNLNEAFETAKHDNKYLPLRIFRSFLQESKSHYTPSGDGSERLMLKYYSYYLMIREFAKNEFNMEILHNIDKFPTDTDQQIIEYRKEIATCLNRQNDPQNFLNTQRYYVLKTKPFISDEKVYYEITLCPAKDAISKFDRFVCYSKRLIASHYSIKADIIYSKINVNGMIIPINIINDSSVSIRPCELNNYAKIFGENIQINQNHREYSDIMTYLSISGSSLYDIVTAPNEHYTTIKNRIFANSKKHRFEAILDKSRDIILNRKKGYIILSYLIHTLNNKVIKNQLNICSDDEISNLYLKKGCIPFETMPFASSLIQHNPLLSDVIECVNSDDREYEFFARDINNEMMEKATIYLKIDKTRYTDREIEENINKFNSRVYKTHQGRRLERFGKYIYVKSAFDDTNFIINRLNEFCKGGLQGYEQAIENWILNEGKQENEDKKELLRNMFSNTCLSVIYGSAGTGKTYTLNLIANFFNDSSKLVLANTNPAVDNLKGKIKANNCIFYTIKKFILNKKDMVSYDVVFIDECSMVSNKDIAELLELIDFKLIVLVGDVYQIESIDFGNWFFLLKYFIPKKARHELCVPYRTKDKKLLDFWKKVRNNEADLTECIVNNNYSLKLDSSVFDKKADDEIVLCLNYDGFYGINNINKYLQEQNKNELYRWGLWTFKVGDPVLFNETERFAPVLYNNLKGEIVNIEIDNDQNCIWFSVKVDKTLTGLDIEKHDMFLLESDTPGKSIVKFKVVKKDDSNDDNYKADETDIPFQIAYCVSIHKAQGLEYDSVKIIITKESEERITHNIFYTAITRTKKDLRIYWSPEVQNKILNNFEIKDLKNDAKIFSAHSNCKMVKNKE